MAALLLILLLGAGPLAALDLLQHLQRGEESRADAAAEFLGGGAGQLRYSKDFGSRRRIGTPKDEQNRLYVAEPVPTITGAKAEHRLPLQAQHIHALAAAVAAACGVAGATTGTLPAGTTTAVSARNSPVAASRSAVPGRCTKIIAPSADIANDCRSDCSSSGARTKAMTNALAICDIRLNE